MKLLSVMFVTLGLWFAVNSYLTPTIAQQSVGHGLCLQSDAQSGTNYSGCQEHYIGGGVMDPNNPPIIDCTGSCYWGAWSYAYCNWLYSYQYCQLDTGSVTVTIHNGQCYGLYLGCLGRQCTIFGNKLTTYQGYAPVCGPLA